MSSSSNPYARDGMPLNQYVGIRLSKPMATMLKAEAALHQTDVSAVIRKLIIEGAKVRGIKGLM